MSDKHETESGHDRMWRAMVAFTNALHSVPGWKAWKSAHFARVIYADDELTDGRPEVFEFPDPIDKQHDIFMQYLGLIEVVESVKGCEYYFRRYPFRGLPIARHEHIANICEMYFGRFYQFKERLKSFTDAIKVVEPNHGLDFGRFIRQFEKEFNSELRARNQVHHHQRFSDLAIEQIYMTGFVSEIRPGKGWGDEHFAAYRKTAKEWAHRVKVRSKRLDDFVEALALATCGCCNFIDALAPLPQQ